MKKCNGIKSSGHWKGYQCSNEGKYKGPDDEWYCYAHIKKAEEKYKYKCGCNKFDLLDKPVLYCPLCGEKREDSE